jgi:hypothetical protein
MLLLVLAGLWALVLGKIQITRSLSLEGTRARWYGVTLLVIAPIYGFLGALALGVLGVSDAVSMAVRAAILLAIIVGLVPLFRGKPSTAAS